jgi:hypothetical protein
MLTAMARSPSPRERVPNANNPRLLARLLEYVAQGVRSPRGLAELMECETRTVNYYVQAGQWLRLLEPEEIRLTALGLELVYASGRERAQVYARAAWAVPLVQRIMQGRSELPETEILAEILLEASPGLAPSTARRRASAVRGLLAPVVRFPPAREAEPEQLALPLSAAAPPPAPSLLPSGAEEELVPNLEVYLFVYRAVLEHGELTLGQLRALLDEAGGRDRPVGTYVEMAQRRGDVQRVDERLVVTRGAVARRASADSATGVALTDPGYREYLKVLRQVAGGAGPRARAYGRLNHRYARWDDRVFGAAASPAMVARELDRVLLGRPLAAYPLAGDAGRPVPAVEASFLERFPEDELAITLPGSLRAIGGGLAAINAALAYQTSVRLPEVMDRRAVVHGGLLYPGEQPPRHVADRISLRLRFLSRVPHAALTAALLLAHRRLGSPWSLQRRNARTEVLRGREILGDLLEVLDGYMRARGWLVSRLPRRGLSSGDLIELLEGLGVVTCLSRKVALREDFFARLQTEIEDREVYESLQPVEDALVRYLEELPAVGVQAQGRGGGEA